MITQSSKSGLTYFPLPIIFIFNRPLRRIMKKEGDGAMAILLNAITMIYSDNGYYVKVNDLFYEDISANLFQHDVDEVVRVIELAVRFGMFDQQMFEKHSILTSDDIQRQFLFCTRRRAISTIEPQYLLLDEKELPNKDKIKADVKKRMARRKEINPTKDNAISVTDNPVFVTDNAISVTDNPVSVTDSAISVTDNTQIKEKEIKENQSKENIPPQAPPMGSGGQEVEENFMTMPMSASTKTKPNNASCNKPIAAKLEKPTAPKRKVWTQDEIDKLTVPNDGAKRSLDLLRDNLKLFKVGPAEQYAIICKSNYGMIGNAVWQAFNDLRMGGSKIKFPGKFLLSKIV